LKFLDYGPIEFVSALTGARTNRLFTLIERAYQAARRRIPTAELNRFFGSLDLDRASVPAGQRVKILYLTPPSVAPPTFLPVHQPRPARACRPRPLPHQPAPAPV